LAPSIIAAAREIPRPTSIHERVYAHAPVSPSAGMCTPRILCALRIMRKLPRAIASSSKSKIPQILICRLLDRRPQDGTMPDTPRYPVLVSFLSPVLCGSGLKHTHDIKREGRTEL
jgi:hypothetical protein